MTNTQKAFSFFAFALLIGFSSCDSDDDKNNGNGQFTKDEAKSQIATFNTSAKSDLQGIGDASGLGAVTDLFDLIDVDDPFGRTADEKKIGAFFRQKGRALRKVFAPSTALRTAADGPFDFEANKGVYAWDAELEVFEKIDAADIIVIQFPTEGSATNNGQLEILEYSEVEVYDEFAEETVYQPGLLTANLYKDGTKVASTHVEIEWDENGFPTLADIVIEVNPFKLDIVLDDTGATTSLLSISLLRNQETLIATSVTVKYKDSDKTEESLKTIEGYVQVKNLKLQGTVDVEAANAEEVDWNEIMDLALYSDGKKLGDVVFEDENDAYVAYLQYADGSKEKLETVLQPVVDELEELEGDLGVNE